MGDRGESRARAFRGAWRKQEAMVTRWLGNAGWIWERNSQERGQTLEPAVQRGGGISRWGDSERSAEEDPEQRFEVDLAQ